MKKFILVLLTTSILGCFPFSNNKMERMISDLENSNSETFDKEYQKIQKYMARHLNYNNASTILNSINNDFPKREFDFNDTQQDLIQLLRGLNDERIITRYEEIFSTVSGNAQREIIFCLTQINSPKSVKTVLDLLETTRSQPLDFIVFYGWNETLNYGELIFPDILDCLDVRNYQYDILSLLYSYLSNSVISADVLINSRDKFLAVLNQYDKEIETLNLNKDLINWNYTEEYLEVRSCKALLLDIMGYLISDEYEQILKVNLNSDDPRFIYFAAQSLLRNDIFVNKKYFERIAEDDEMRKWLFSFLKENKSLQFIDKSYFSQEELAKSDMVNWLIYPTELASAPDEIILEKIFTETTKEGEVDFYIFKFKKNPPHWAAKKGWMAGVSGPFNKRDVPTIEGSGYTFSSFSSWESQTVDELLEEITGISSSKNDK